MSLITVIGSYPLLAITLCVMLGLLVGSFLNVVIHRLPLMMEREWKAQCLEALDTASAVSEPGHAPEALPAAADEPFNLAVPRSRCPECGHEIKAWENIPVLSYLWLRGRCSACKTPISARYPLVELATGVLSGLIAYLYGFTPLTLALLLLTWTLISLTLIDFDHQLLPDSLTLPLLWLGLLVNSQGLFTDLHSALWGAVAGYLSLWSVYWAFKLLTGKEGMGFGDFKLLAALGAWAGWQLLPLIIILSSLVGAAIDMLLIIARGRERSLAIPFGPFLAIAGGIAMLWGDSIIAAYWHFVGLT